MRQGVRTISPDCGAEKWIVRNWLALLGILREQGTGTRMALASTTGDRGFGKTGFGSAGRTRTYNPSVNSRTAFSRLALQTQDLHSQNADYRVNWGDSGGTLIDLIICWAGGRTSI